MVDALASKKALHVEGTYLAKDNPELFGPLKQGAIDWGARNLVQLEAILSFYRELKAKNDAASDAFGGDRESQKNA